MYLLFPKNGGAVQFLSTQAQGWWRLARKYKSFIKKYPEMDSSKFDWSIPYKFLETRYIIASFSDSEFFELFSIPNKNYISWW